jgi:hypothetical protein
MASILVPQKTTVLVVGGGPAGSYAASVLARRNMDVTVLEAAKFPRYHIGESLLASVNYFLEYIGAREKVLAHGFIRKPGGAFKLRKDFPEAYTNFVGSPFCKRSGSDELIVPSTRSIIIMAIMHSTWYVYALSFSWSVGQLNYPNITTEPIRVRRPITKARRLPRR